jgi:hypothetical protein
MGILHHRHGAHGRHICDLHNLAAISCISAVRVKGLTLALLPVQTVFFNESSAHVPVEQAREIFREKEC